jgi:hypothetical protein
VPCDALGGVVEGEAPYLRGLADDETDDDETRLQLTPMRDEDGAMSYEAIEFQIHPIAEASSPSVTVKATREGAGYLANRHASLLDAKKGWKKIRLQLERALVIEGWVDAATFEPDDGSGDWPEERRGYLDGGHSAAKVPTYCSAKLAVGTPILGGDRLPWASVSREVEGIFVAGKERHQLVNFLGRYRDAFCAPHWHSLDMQGHRDCLGDAEVRAEDVKLVCPAPKVR